MGEVKRYELQGDGALLWRDDGKYVLHSDYATLEAERDALRALVGTVREIVGCADVRNVADVSAEQHSREIGAEVAKLTAACGQMRAALIVALQVIDDRPAYVQAYVEKIANALSTDAGKNYIDATGAVESHCYICAHEKYPDGPFVVRCRVPIEWSGSRVLIVRVAK